MSRGAFGSSMLVALRIAGSVGGEMMIVGLFVCVSLGFCARSQWRIFCLLLLSVPDVPGSEVELGTSFVFLAFLSLAERLIAAARNADGKCVRSPGVRLPFTSVECHERHRFHTLPIHKISPKIKLNIKHKLTVNAADFPRTIY